VYFNKQSSKEATGQIMTNTIRYSILGQSESTRELLIERLVSSFLAERSLNDYSTSIPLGEGLWAIELKVNDYLYIGSIIGSNGIHSEEDDLWEEYYSITKKARNRVRDIGMLDRNNNIHVNNYNQLLKYKHTPEQEMESLDMMRYRYNVILEYIGIDRKSKDRDYNERFNLYKKKNVFFEKYPILLELEGYNDEIICNLLYALHMVGDLNKAVQSIRKDILRTYGTDYYYGLCCRVEHPIENFPYINYGDNNIHQIYLENLN
jgi:hypothetical protein